MPMKSLLRAILLLLVFPVVAIPQQTVTGNFEYDGLNRTYRLYIPDSYDPGVQSPLVLNLHGYGSNNIEQELYGDFRPVADTAGFLVVHPNGTPDAFNIMHWNTFGTSNVDDVGFLSALIDTLSANYNINPKRVYSTGMSNGGFMSFSLACFLSDRIAAIASVTGTMISANLSACMPSRPVPILQIHGTADGTVPYDGNLLFVSVQALLNYWIGHNSCDTSPIITDLPDLDPDDGCTARHYLWANGDAGSVVEHYRIIGGGHSWPGAPININITNMDFSASEEIWRFFSSYDLDGLVTTTGELGKETDFVKAYPNPGNELVTLRFQHPGRRQVTLMDLSGRAITTVVSENDEIALELPSAGMFIARIEEQSHIYSIKMIRSH